tara:strand:- start:599 stop:862 length:264 start_codon:yes stop_codon:yes gene_type:complete
MALQKSMTSGNGFTASSAYGRIVEVQYNRNKTTAKMHWYKDQASADTNSRMGQDTVEFTADLDGANLVSQAYASFKGLEHLSDTTDV